jgi:hypothetical protein
VNRQHNREFPMTPNMEIFFTFFGIALALVTWGLSESGLVPRRVALGAVVLGALFFLVGVGYPLYRKLFTPITYIYLFPGRGLGGASAEAPHDFTLRRAFVVERSGPEVLQNVEITLRDDRATGQANAEHIERYPEIGPDASNSGASQPKHFWFAPAKPWAEEYTVTLKSGERVFIERIAIWGISPPAIPGAPTNPPSAPKVTFGVLGAPDPEMGRVALAIRVLAYEDDHVLFTCRDLDFQNLPEWAHDKQQPCPVDGAETLKFGFLLDPKPFVLSFPGGILDMTPSGLPQLSSHPETQPDNRDLSGWQKSQMVKILAKFPGQRILIVSAADAAAMRYAKDFRDVFQESHWVVKGPIEGLKKTDCTPVDVGLLAWKDDFGKERSHVMAVQDALVAAGVKGGKHHECVLASPRALVLRVGVKSPDEVSDDMPACAPRLSPEIDALVARFK